MESVSFEDMSVAIEDIEGSLVNREIICTDCVVKMDEKELMQSRTITRRLLERLGEALFCDHCGKQLGLPITIDKDQERKIEEALARLK